MGSERDDPQRRVPIVVTRTRVVGWWQDCAAPGCDRRFRSKRPAVTCSNPCRQKLKRARAKRG